VVVCKYKGELQNVYGKNGVYGGSVKIMAVNGTYKVS
jgi:hypothetical protein